MSYTILQVNNIGLSHGSDSLPFIQVVVDPATFSIQSRAEGLDFLNDIYNLSTGFVAVGEFVYTSRSYNDTFAPDVPTSDWNEVGNTSSGWYTASQHFLMQSSYGGIYRTRTRYDGNMVSRAEIPDRYIQSASGKFYYSLSVIVTTPDNKVYKCNEAVSGIVCESDTQPGYTIRSNQVCVANMGGTWIRTENRPTADWTPTNWDITDDITGIIPGDPYEPGGESDTGGGTGNFDGTSDPIDIPPLPSISAVDTGFITLFNPSTSELDSLANYMWSSGFDLDTFKKLFADPMQAILGLSIVPVTVPNAGPAVVTVGNISTGVSMNKASRQYVAVDCGTINVNEYWGAYLDYDPYTKAEIYLPYIGIHALSVDDIMGKAVHVVYHVDVLSGACCAYVKCGSSVLYSFVGHCSSSIPITGNDWTNVINGVLTVAGSIGSMVATGGASAPLAVPALASTAVNGMKPNVEKSGSLSGTGGLLGIQKPYLILTRPKQALPKNQNHFMGYPSFITATLSSVNGYAEIESIHLENIHATGDELSEIESLLKSGVIF